MIQIWCVFLYNSEHRCLLNFICSEIKQKREVTVKTISEYKNSYNLAIQLRDGFLITMTDRKQDKTQVIQINKQFYFLLPRLIQKIKDVIDPELKKFKDFNPLEKKKRCEGCQMEKSESELNFMGHKCDCATPNFVEIKLDTEKKARYEQL